MCAKVPKVDLTSVAGDGTIEESRAVARVLVDGFRSHGMVLLSGHGVSQQLQDQALSASEGFFGLEREDKLSVRVNSSIITRGYLPPGQESGSKHQELKEGFSYGHEPTSSSEVCDDGLRALNRWPSSLSPAHTENLNAIYRELCRVSLMLTRALALVLPGLEDLEKICSDSEAVSLMRCFHYFPQLETCTMGSSPHTDWGFLTVILPEPGKTGLELFHQQRWLPVECPPGILVANCGDFLSILSNGGLCSPLHRVLLSKEERTSFVLFYYPNSETTLKQAIPSLAHTLSKSGMDLSLFTNQSHDSNGAVGDYDTQAFGDLMLWKWKQVYRDIK